MSLRTLFLMVGATWGLILGGLVGEAAFVLIFGVGWLPILSGDSWPEIANRALPAIAVLAGILIFAICVVAGWRYGARAMSRAANQPRARRAGFGLLGLSLAILVGIAALSQIDTDSNVADQETSDAQEAALANLTAARHTIDRIEFFGWNADTGSAGIVMRGNRSGDYHLTWQVVEPANGQVLADGRQLVSLGPGRRTVVVPLARDHMIEAYREKVLKGAGGVSIDALFRLAAAVEPALSPEESAALPPSEIQNLAAGRSALRSDVGIDFPMSFQVPDVRSIQTD